MADDPNIGKVLNERELFTREDIFEFPESGQRLFPYYSGDGSISINPCLVMKIEGKLRTYSLEQAGKLWSNATFKILRQLGKDQ